MKKRKNILHILFLMIFFSFLNIQLFGANLNDYPNIAKDMGKMKTIELDSYTIEETLRKLKMYPMATPQTQNIFDKIAVERQSRTTQTYTKLKVFESKFTCEGITANLDDIVPYIVDLVETVIENIPEYAMKRIIGKDISTPASSYELIIEIMMNIYCLIQVIPSTVGMEQGLRSVPELISSLFSTNKKTTEVGAADSNGDSPYIDTIKKLLGTGVSVNTNAGTQTASSLASDILESIMDKNTKCVEGLRIWVNDILTPSIKDFRPYKIASQKSYCEMADTYKKQTAGNNFDLYSPIRWKNTQENFCIEDQFQKVCKNTDPSNQKAISIINVDKMKEYLDDGISLPNLSNTLVNNFTSKEMFTLGFHIVDSLTICINNPTIQVCKEIDCTDNSDQECQGTMERLKNIPLKYTVSSLTNYDDYKDNFIGFDSLITKLKIKKIQCLRLEIMNTEEKYKFVKSFARIFNSGFGRNFEASNINSAEAVKIFDNMVINEYCNNHMKLQIQEYDNLLKNKVFNIKMNNVKSDLQIQENFSKIQRLKMVFNKSNTSLANVVDACTYKKGGTNPQTTFDVLIRDASGNLSIVSKPTNFESASFTHASAEFTVKGTCVNDASGVCVAMNCSYDETEIASSYEDLKNDTSNSVVSKEELKYMTQTEYIEKIEKDRIKTYENIYNKYNILEKEFTNKVLTPQLIRYMIENSYFIY